MKKHVLICEDDEGIIDVVSIVLLDKGYTVDVIINGKEIFNRIKGKRPDVILLDLWMPEITGEEIALRLKADKLTADIPIIFVSASKDLKKIASSTEVNDFLPKPFDIIDLENIVEKYVN